MSRASRVIVLYPDLREVRRQFGLTQADLARLAGVSVSTIGTIERKRNFGTYLTAINSGDYISKTNFETVIRICVVLNYMKPGAYTFEQVLRKQKLFRKEQITDRGRRPQGIPQDGRPMIALAA